MFGSTMQRAVEPQLRKSDRLLTFLSKITSIGKFTVLQLVVKAVYSGSRSVFLRTS